MVTEVQGQTAIAKIIADTLGVVFKKQYVVKFQQRQIDPFPRPNERNRFDIQHCLEWAKRHFEKNGKADDKEANLMQQAADAVARKKIRMDSEHEYDFNVKQGLYVLRREAEIATIGLAKQFLMIVRDEIRAEFVKDSPARGESLIDRLDMKIKEAANE